MAEEKKRRAYRPAAETRELIRETAMDMMLKNGYQGTTIRDICKKLSIPAGTFYNCFGSKLELLRDFYTEGDTYFETTVRSEIAGKPIDAQLELYAAHYAMLNERTGLERMRVLFNPENEIFSQPRQMQGLLREIFAEGQRQRRITTQFSPEEFVELAFDILRGVAYVWCISNGAFDMQTRSIRQMRLFFAGIRAQ